MTLFQALWNHVYHVNLGGELLSQSWGCTQKSLLVAQQRERKVRFGIAAALSSHVLPVTIPVNEELHEGARWRQQRDCVCCNNVTVKAQGMLSSEHFACCAGSSVVNSVAGWYTFWGETFCFLVVLLRSYAFLGAVQLDKPRLRSYCKTVILNKTSYDIIKRKP